MVRVRDLLLILVSCLGTAVHASQDSEHSDTWIKEAVATSGFQLSMISEENFRSWMTFVEPTLEELDWNAIRWHQSLSAAVVEAKKLNRPILLWTMNGHPFSTT